jgi:multiple sugar transport system permease protein
MWEVGGTAYLAIFLDSDGEIMSSTDPVIHKQAGMKTSRDQKKRSSLARQDAFWGYLFISPQLLGFFLVVLGPLIAVLVFSFQERNLLFGTTSFIGFDNYQQIFTNDRLFGQVLLTSLKFTLLLVPLNLATSIFLSLLLAKELRGVNFFRVLYFAPVITSAAAWAIVWRFLLQGEQGTLNQFLAMIGITGPNWLHDPNWALFSVAITRVIKNVGLNIVILLAAVTNIPSEYEEAATVDGANQWQVFSNITLPLLMPTLLFVSVITVIGSLRVFDTILLMTEGGPGNATLVLVYYIYYHAFQFFETGYASALAIILFVIALALTALQWMLRNRIGDEEHE